jgi:hypothetical protein
MLSVLKVLKEPSVPLLTAKSRDLFKLLFVGMESMPSDHKTKACPYCRTKYPSEPMKYFHYGGLMCFLDTNSRKLMSLLFLNLDSNDSLVAIEARQRMGMDALPVPLIAAVGILDGDDVVGGGIIKKTKAAKKGISSNLKKKVITKTSTTTKKNEVTIVNCEKKKKVTIVNCEKKKKKKSPCPPPLPPPPLLPSPLPLSPLPQHTLPLPVSTCCEDVRGERRSCRSTRGSWLTQFHDGNM